MMCRVIKNTIIFTQLLCLLSNILCVTKSDTTIMKYIVSTEKSVKLATSATTHAYKHHVSVSYNGKD